MSDDYQKYLQDHTAQALEAGQVLSERGVPRSRDGQPLPLVQRLLLFLQLIDKKVKPQ